MELPAQDPKNKTTERGKRPRERVLQHTERPEATERGYQDYQEGRHARLEDVSNRSSRGTSRTRSAGVPSFSV